LDEALKGRYSYLRGLVMAYTCEHIRSAFQSWKVHVPADYAWLLDMPGQVNTPAAHTFYLHEIKDFVQSLESHFGVEYDEEKLSRSIDLFNRQRELIRALYEYRKSDPPLISGAEMYYVNVSGMVAPREEHVSLLEELLEWMKGRTEAPATGTRLMITGSALFNPGVFEAVEKQGAVVVTDDLCVGTRYYWGNVSKDKEPLAAICDRYMDRIVCPNKHPADSRYQHILDMVEGFDAQGVLIIHQKFCDPHEFDRPHIEARLKERNIPSAFIEIESTFSDAQISGPVNALQDIIESSKVS
jgi:benzoyl-CoA reductase subunit C